MKRIPTDLSVEAIMLAYNKSERTAFRYKKDGIPLSAFSRYRNSDNGATDKNLKPTVKIDKMTQSLKNDNVNSTDNLTDKIDYLTNKVENLESLVKSLVLEIRSIKTTDKNTDTSTDKDIDIIDSNTNIDSIIVTNTNKQDSIESTYTLPISKNDTVINKTDKNIKSKSVSSKNTIPAIQEMITAEEFKLFKELVVDKYPKSSNTYRLNAVVQEYMTLSHEEKQELFDCMDKVVSVNKGRSPQHIKNFLSFLKDRHWQILDYSVLNASQPKSQINVSEELSRRMQRQYGA